MADNNSKKTGVGYKTDIPEDVLDAALGSVQEKRKRSSDDEDAGIEVEVASPSGEDESASDQVEAEPADEASEPTGTSDSSAEAGADDNGEGEGEGPSVEDLIAAGEVPQPVIARLEAEQERARAAQERMLRALAETENVRRRLAKQKEEALRHANEDLLKDLLPVLDNLELCVAHSGTENNDQLAKGVQMTLRQWYKVFEKANATPIEAEVGGGFDPSVHEAVMQDDQVDLPPNTIARVLQTGFLYGDRLLRPTMVSVATGARQSADDSASGDEPAAEDAAAEAAAADETASDEEPPDGEQQEQQEDAPRGNGGASLDDDDLKNWTEGNGNDQNDEASEH